MNGIGKDSANLQRGATTPGALANTTIEADGIATMATKRIAGNLTLIKTSNRSALLSPFSTFQPLPSFFP